MNVQCVRSFIHGLITWFYFKTTPKSLAITEKLRKGRERKEEESRKEEKKRDKQYMLASKTLPHWFVLSAVFKLSTFTLSLPPPLLEPAEIFSMQRKL